MSEPAQGNMPHVVSSERTGQTDTEISNPLLQDERESTTVQVGSEPKGNALTFRAVSVGLLVGAAVAAQNINFGLKTGWSQGGSLLAAILGIALFSAIRPLIPYTDMEANITQTVASAAGSMASAGGLLGPIPALKMLGYDYDLGTLMLWGTFVAFIGVFFAVPLRQQLLVRDNLKFPSGLATYTTISVMFSAGGEEARARAKVLVYFAAGASAYTIFTYFIPQAEKPPILDAIGLSSVAAFGWGLLIDPLLFGAGFLCGGKAGASMFGGAVIAWGIIAPLVKHSGLAPGPEMDMHSGARGWVLWPGVTLLVVDALVSMLLVVPWKKVIGGAFVAITGKQAFDKLTDVDTPKSRVTEPTNQTEDSSNSPEQDGSDVEESLMSQQADNNSSEEAEPTGTDVGNIPMSWPVIGLCLSIPATTVVLWKFFGLQIWQPILAVPISYVLAYIAVRCAGETDINPVGAMGKVTQLVFAVIAPNNMVANLMAAAIAGAGASQAGDMMQDLKTGFLLGQHPRQQFIGQLIGIVGGICVAVPIYKLFDKAYTFGSSTLPAPAAQAWKAVAEVLDEGFSSLPKGAPWAMLAAGICGVILPILALKSKGKKIAKWIPTGTTVGLAFVIFADQSTIIAAGSLVAALWGRHNPEQRSRLESSVASGLIAGAGVTGVVNAALALAGVPRILEPAD